MKGVDSFLINNLSQHKLIPFLAGGLVCPFSRLQYEFSMLHLRDSSVIHQEEELEQIKNGLIVLEIGASFECIISNRSCTLFSLLLLTRFRAR